MSTPDEAIGQDPTPTEMAEPPIDISFKTAWDVWREDTRFQELEPELRAAIRCGFIAGWRARDALMSANGC